MDILKRIAEEFSLASWQVENTVKLIDEGNTIPFIARYRKEATGALDDQLLRKLADRLAYLRGMEERKVEIIRLLTEMEKLTPELEAQILACEKLAELEDIYRPFKPKRRTRAMVAKEKGLEPLAELLLEQTVMEGAPEELAAPYVSEEKGVANEEEALAGAMDIIAELVSDNADYRKWIRAYTLRTGFLVAAATGQEESGKKRDVYQMYHEFSEELRRVANHRVLALNRGEKEGFLSVKIEVETEEAVAWLQQQMTAKKRSITTPFVELAVADAYKRLIAPSMETEIRNLLTDRAQEGAMELFTENLRNLLLQPPMKGKTVLGLDPGYRTGCKLAVVDDTGKVLDIGVIYPTLGSEPQIQRARETVAGMIRKHKVELVAIGNGTASKESEIFIAELIRDLNLSVSYAMVSESGASVYSASPLAAEEFPDFDVSQRSAVSIARRLQDPLAELVKIDPKAIGVGQYQHDMNQKRLGEALGGVVEGCVNSVGVELNTASPSLLSYVAGVSSAVAKNIVAFREEEGRFTSRKQLLKVKKLGAKAYEQCAGFLRIQDAKNVLDNTGVHPESYEAAEKLLALAGCSLEDVRHGKIDDLKEKLAGKSKEELAEACGVGALTVQDIIEELLKPGRDPRDELEKPQLRTDVMDMKDLKPGMIMTGTVRNVIDFGAFVDIGVHQDGLVHISQICDRFLKHPREALSVGDIVKVKVLSVDTDRARISLTMRDL